MALRNKVRFSKPGRRESIQLGAASAAAGLLESQVAVNQAVAKDSPRGPYTTPFAIALPTYTAKAPVDSLAPLGMLDDSSTYGECGRKPLQRLGNWALHKFYTLNARAMLHSFHPELPTQQIWGYDGLLPGLTLVERHGVPIVVRIQNDLPAISFGFGSPEISTDLHNLHCACDSDGFAGDHHSANHCEPKLTEPEKYQDHCYSKSDAGDDDPHAELANRASRKVLGALGHHDHRPDFTGTNAHKSLAGFCLMFDEVDSGNELDTNPKALRLPSGIGRYDIPLAFQDKQFDSSGYLFFNQLDNKGTLGNKFCVNGKVQPYFKVERRKYRFRLLDGSLSRFYEFYLTDGSGANQSFVQIANDDNLLPAPLATSMVPLAPAERADVVIDFARYPIGTTLYLVNRLIQTNGRGPEGPPVNSRGANGLLTKAGTRILRFDVEWDPVSPDLSQLPSKLRTLPPINLAEVVKNRRFEFDKENQIWTVNGKIFDVQESVAQPKRGTAEIWTLKGRGSWHHPVHIHLDEGRILTRNGEPPAPHESGRKDVFVLAPNDEVRVFIRFRDLLGPCFMHCHNLTHEDHAMMVRFDVVE